MKIVYRIVAALLAISVIPAAYFLDMLRVRISISLIDKAVQDDVSISRMYSLFSQGGTLNGLFSGKGDFFSNASVKALMPAGICFLAFFALAIILSLVIFFFAVFSNKRLVITCLGGGGLLCIIAAYISFGRVAAPLLDGSITIADFLNMGVLGFLVNAAAKVTVLRLTSAPMIMAFIFAAIIIWGLAFVLTEDESEKREAKLKKMNKKSHKTA